MCSVALLCSSIECGKHKKKVKKEKPSGVYEKKIHCSPSTTIDAFRTKIARALRAEVEQVGIIFGEKDLSFQGESTLKELMISTKSKPSVVIHSGVWKPSARRIAQQKKLGTSDTDVKTEVQKDIDEFLND